MKIYAVSKMRNNIRGEADLRYSEGFMRFPFFGVGKEGGTKPLLAEADPGAGVEGVAVSDKALSTFLRCLPLNSSDGFRTRCSSSPI